MRRIPRLLLTFSLTAALLLPAEAALAFSDVPSSHWAHTAISYVAKDRDWMLDFGTSTFKPGDHQLRKHLARALVKAFAPTTPLDDSITFPDLPKTDYWYQWAAKAVKLGWIPKYASGRWAPNDPIRVSGFDRAIVRAMGLTKPAAGLANIKESDGDRYYPGEMFPYLIITHSLGLHINHSDEKLDIGPGDLIRRDEVAYSLWKSKVVESWKISGLSRFENIQLGALSVENLDKRALVSYALKQAGQPYIYGGEWKTESPLNYCCGYQPRSGLDCSGFIWWVLKRYEGGYNAAQFRPYLGWALPERSSSLMAQATKTKIEFGQLQVGDMMFFASNGGGSGSDVDHVGLYVGNNWMIHSASSNDGVTLDWVGSGSYYNEHFVYGRRVVGVVPAVPVFSENVSTAGDAV